MRCASAALATDPAERPTARALADGVQRYLDGDRDLALRRDLGAAQLATARAASTRAKAGDADAHAAAIRAASHAFALDPGSAEAAHLVTSLILEPPRTISPGLASRLRDVDARTMAEQWRTATAAYATLFVFVPFLFWQGVRDWSVVVLGYACIAGIIVVGRSRLNRLPFGAPLALVLNTACMLCLARIYGPFLVVPGILVIETFAWMAYPRFIDHPWGPLSLMILAQLVPVALKRLGIVSSTWMIGDHSIGVMPAAIELGGTATEVTIVVAALATVLVAGVFSRALAKGRRDAQRELEVQSWHLRHLLPT